MQTILKEDFSTSIAARYTSFNSSIPFAADMVWKDEAQSSNENSVVNKYYKNIEDIKNINNYIENNNIVNLQLSMNFLEKMIASSVQQTLLTTRGQSMTSPSVAVTVVPENKTVLIDKTKTQKLIQNQLESFINKNVIINIDNSSESKKTDYTNIEVLNRAVQNSNINIFNNKTTAISNIDNSSFQSSNVISSTTSKAILSSNNMAVPSANLVHSENSKDEKQSQITKIIKEQNTVFTTKNIEKTVSGILESKATPSLITLPKENTSQNLATVSSENRTSETPIISAPLLHSQKAAETKTESHANKVFTKDNIKNLEAKTEPIANQATDKAFNTATDSNQLANEVINRSNKITSTESNIQNSANIAKTKEEKSPSYKRASLHYGSRENTPNDLASGRPRLGRINKDSITKSDPTNVVTSTSAPIINQLTSEAQYNMSITPAATVLPITPTTNTSEDVAARTNIAQNAEAAKVIETVKTEIKTAVTQSIVNSNAVKNIISNQATEITNINKSTKLSNTAITDITANNYKNLNLLVNNVTRNIEQNISPNINSSQTIINPQTLLSSGMARASSANIIYANIPSVIESNNAVSSTANNGNLGIMSAMQIQSTGIEMAPMLFKKELQPMISPKKAPVSFNDDEDDIKTIRKRTVVKKEEVTNTVTAINAPGKATSFSQSQGNINKDVTTPTSAQIEVIADKVYKALERRLRTEKSRLGRL